MANPSGKDTIYIDIDDEITTIIEKVASSKEKIVALVLPKRASVLQSIVNMKLLKRRADQDKKHLVLITSEASLLPLAGTVGLYVAKSLQSKPEIPALGAAVANDDDILADEPADDEDFSPSDAANRPVGELAGLGATSLAAGEGIETLEMEDDPTSDDTTDAADTAGKSKSAKTKKNKKLGVPNFERFRLLLVLGVLALVGLIVFLYLAIAVLPKASIAITTDTSSIDSNLSLTADTAAKSLDPAKLVLPATAQKVDKTGSQQVPTTGKVNQGQRATGTISMSAGACSANVPNDVPSGTGVSGSGLTFITQQNTSFVPTISHGKCVFQASSSTPVTAQTGGANYNIAPTNFSVAQRSDISASSSNAFSGGTDNIVQVVAQSDIDGATQKIAAQNADEIKQQLQQQLQQAGQFALTATFVAGTPNTSASAKVGDQVGTVTVTQTTTYTMLGVKEADLKTLIDNDIKDKIDPSKQTILSEGLDKATFKANSASAGNAQLAMSTTATAGPDLKVDDIKQQVAGKKAGDIKAMLKADPGVTDVSVHYSPFWVTSVPNKPSKVTITFQKQ